MAVRVRRGSPDRADDLGLARRIQDAPAGTRPRLDLVGAVLSAAGLGLAVFGVLRSSVWGWVLPKPGGTAILGLSPTIVLIFAGLFVLWLFGVGSTTSRSGEPSRWSGCRCSGTGSSPAAW
jgi:hypothetical protein